MQKNISPGAFLVVIVALVLIIGAAYYFALHGAGKPAAPPAGATAPPSTAPVTPTSGEAAKTTPAKAP